MPNTRHTRKNPKMAADVQQISGSIENMKNSLFEELKKLKMDAHQDDSNAVKLIDSKRGNADVPCSDAMDSLDAPQKVSFTDLINTFEAKAKIIFENTLIEVERIVQELNKRLEALNRDTGLNCLVFYGVAEDSMGHKQTEEIANTISQKLHLTITPNDIDYCFRLGKKHDTATDKVRPLLVRFTNRWKRNLIYDNKKHFKGSGILVGEMLTKEMFALYKLVRERVGNKTCWTWKGNIYIQYKGNKVMIDSVVALEDRLSN